MRRLVLAVAILAALLATVAGGLSPGEAAVGAESRRCKPAKQFGVVFVLDDSGSNRETDPRLLRSDAVKVALGYVPAGALVAGVRFSDAAATDVPVTRLTNANRGSIAAYIRDNLESNGATNYEAGFQQAIVELQKMSSAQRIVIFLSDGMPTSSYSSDRLIGQQVIPIHTVGYGPVRNLPVLIDIARRSGGSYQPIDNVAEASNAFATIVNPYQCNKPIYDDTAKLGPRRPYRKTFRVTKPLAGISAIATWTRQTVPRIRLIRPDGTSLPGDGVRQGEGVRVEGVQAKRFDVTRPHKGVWTIEAISRVPVNLAFNVWSTQDRPIALRRFKYVALGDSYSSGEGVSPYLGGGGHKCHRSSRAYATRVQPRVYNEPLYAIASGGGKSRDLNKYGSNDNVRRAGGVTWAFWACSGAVANNVVTGGAVQPHQKAGDGKGYAQLDSPSVDSDADLVTITIGGNDTGFANALEYCFYKDCTVSWFESNHESIIRDLVKRQLVKTFRAVGKAMPNARVLVLGYPQVFPKSKAEQNCWGLRQFREEQDMLRRLGNVLNETIAEAVKEARKDAGRLEFVPVMDRFAGHEVCGDKGGWILGLAKGAFHPNELGHRLGYAAAINEVLQDGRP